MMRLMIGLLIALLSLLIAIEHCAAKPRAPYYWTTRKLVCETISGHQYARCSLRNPEVNTEINPMCHEELNEKTNQSKVYCRIMCEESDDTTVLAKVPNWNHVCNIFYNYQLQRFREDWYLWRTDECLNTTITFEVRCGFSRDSRIFYRQNSKLFEYDDSEDETRRSENWRVAF